MNRPSYVISVLLASLFFVSCGKQEEILSPVQKTGDSVVEQKIDLGFNLKPSANYIENTQKYKQYRVKIDGDDVNYYIHYPSNKSKSANVLIALHGSGRTGVSMLDTWQDTANREGFIVMAPNSKNIQGWGNSDSINNIFSALDNDLQSKGWRRKKIYLFGHSSGGLYAMSELAEQAAKFDAVAVHGAAQSKSSIGFLSKGTPLKVGIFVGDSDDLFSVVSAKENIAWLAKDGFKPSLFIIKNHSHWYYENYNRLNQTIWRFLIH